MIENKPAVPGDSLRLCLRPEDAEEASPGWQDRVEQQIAHGNVRAFWEGDHLVALAGITPGPDFLSPWLLTSERVTKHAKVALRIGRGVVQALQREPHTVGNYIGKSAKTNRRFVEALGFLILPCPSGDHDFFYLPKHV
ncbi:MAG: hypothetical protein ACK4K3_07435 [Aquabacterium sp.]